MPLTVGDKIGPYEILALIGKGGMGEVYRAKDTRLGRDVAIKFSQEKFSERFDREARAVAALNHPNICALYDVGPNYLVMEYIEGRSPAGPLPMEEALGIAKQIADALGEAHEKRIVHRDLKPGNIMIKSDGTVKVLDFGLAKMGGAPAAQSEDSPTLSMAATQAGVILGTAAYMAPEQAKGRPVDKRADIWAFGVVLYELFAGRRLFQGETVSEILAGVLKEEPDWTRVPAEARPLLKKCLQKDPKNRLHDIADAFALVGEQTEVHRGAKLPWAIAGALAVVAAIAFWAPWRTTSATPPPPMRFNVDLGSDVVLNNGAGDVVLSPDGTRLLYVSKSRLWTRLLDQPAPVQLSGTEDARAPFFSPNGQWIAFFADGKLKKLPVQGGEATVLCDAPGPTGGSWGEDGNIIAVLAGTGNDAVLSRIPEAGGKPEPVTQLNRERGEVSHRFPQILPGAKAAIFTSVTAATGLDGGDVQVVRLADRKTTTLIRKGMYARYVSAPSEPGYLAFVRLGTLFAVPFDPESLELRGTPAPVLDEIAYYSGGSGARFDIARNGTLVYGTRSPLNQLVTVNWIDAAGNTQPLVSTPSDYLYPKVSPDGKRVAFATGGDISVYNPQRGIRTRLTSDGASTYPLWTPDGQYVVFQEQGGMSWTRPDGAAKPQSLSQSKSFQFPWSFSPDGKRLAFIQMNTGTGYDIWTAPVENDEKGLRLGNAEPFLQTTADERHPVFSPDGHWLAYTSNDSGALEVYVRAFPDKGRKWQVSNNGGSYPEWSPTGHELLFRLGTGSQLMTATYSVEGGEFLPGKPQPWTPAQIANVGVRGAYDIAPDGKHVAALLPAEVQPAEKPENHILFLLNFPEELRRRVPVGK